MESTEEAGGAFSRYHRLDPTNLEAVTYFLPRLISGETLHGAERRIYRVDVYACEPKDLAEKFPPAPQAEQRGDRFFFATSKRLKGRGNRSARGAGAGRWNINSTKDINDTEGDKVGEIKKLSFVSNSTGKATGWVMEEYRCLRPEAIVADGEKVFCRIHLAPTACAAARQESAAYKRRQDADSVSAAQAPKRPAPVAADPPSPKKMRVAVTTPVAQKGYSDSEAFVAPPPSFMPAAVLRQTAAAVDEPNDMDRYTCTIEELLGGCGVQDELPLEYEKDNDDEYAPSTEEILGWLEDDDQALPVVDDEQPKQLPVESENDNDDDEYAPSVDEILVWMEDDDQALPVVDDEQSKHLPPFKTGEPKDLFDPDFIRLLNDPSEFTCFEPLYAT